MAGRLALLHSVCVSQECAKRHKLNVDTMAAGKTFFCPNVPLCIVAAVLKMKLILRAKLP